MAEEQKPKGREKKKKAMGKEKDIGKSKIAVIRIKGRAGKSKEIEKTMNLLNLPKKNSCSVVTPTAATMGMIKKVKDLVTWGELDKETEKELIEKRKKTEQKTFYLHPPRKGYGRKGIKISFKTGGALGDRGKKINDIIKRML